MHMKDNELLSKYKDIYLFYKKKKFILKNKFKRINIVEGTL